MASVGGPTDAASVQLQAAYKTFNKTLEIQESTAQQLIESVPAPTQSEARAPEGSVGQNIDVKA